MVLAPELIYLALVIVTLALAWFTIKLVEALIHPLASAFGWVPVIGPSIEAAILSAGQSVINLLGKVEDGCDHLVGGAFSAIAKMADKTWNVIHGQASTLLTLAQLIANQFPAIKAIEAFVHHIRGIISAIEHPLRTLQQAVHGIDRELKALEKDFSHGIGNDVLPQIKHLRKELNVFERSVATDIADAEAQAEAATADLWTWITGIGTKPLKLTFSGAIAVALGAIGLGGLNCLSFSKFLNKWACGLGPLLDALLGLVVSSIVLEETCVLLPFLESAFGDVVGPITHLLTEVPLGPCEKPPKTWATLAVAPGPLPPAQTLGALPT